MQQMPATAAGMAWHASTLQRGEKGGGVAGCPAPYSTCARQFPAPTWSALVAAAVNVARGEPVLWVRSKAGEQG